MIIGCDNCNKKFEINQNLIPPEGRTLQCGNCNNKWFFKLKEQNNNQNLEKIILKENPIDTKPLKKNIDLDTEKKETIKKNIKKKNNVNYFKLFLVIIISIVAFILVLDTFKDNLIVIFPNIKILLNNLYQSLEDIKLFILDLAK